MEAKELMIGDYAIVNKDVCIKKNTIVKIHAIDADRALPERGLKGCATCVPIGEPDEMSGGVWFDYLSPIPLTDAILKANGFEYRHKNFAALSYEHPFQLEMVEWPDEKGIGLWMVGGLLKIRYVHELQHALRLCGIEKEIEL